MPQLIILIVALALAGGVYLFLTISNKKNKEQAECLHINILRTILV